MANAGISTKPMSYAKKEDAQGMGYVDEGGEIPSTDRMREMLARNQASSSLAQGAGGSAEEQMDPRAQLQKQLDKANHYMLVEILPEVISFDIGCFGLTTCLTLPLVYWPIAAIWGLEVYNDYTGNSTPLTPKLSWKSFFPPGTEMDIPLPNPPLWIAWIMYVILLVFATVIWGTMIFLLVYTISDPAAALSGLGEIFPFMTSIIGI
ncbi:hypothetical protein A2348_00185 [Candidatus Uhrbacteria bacterium RIFOXYB12_FULL_58_10]|uniref:Uncharacterized protein n=1 Tax=Candidatus Uhrbacteria bacterium RIFOXYB2_FULL_57_15 TaxID=1802422 RepID=A0A1F7W760_9BACT|nr:MAG: hypothetical protein A2348_00185 [Candidatus Uhrbacteria bacterium RIFOXYB12_FULL_58_10]OGL98645.1 MAG: hypothetical protein A2304_02995 [Candidatus Uhrbacteria bacterium RIFOXYB2_FULL_57_15]OGL99992.1 MAG: hypothetical protein A2501_02640 [Candidatus Uhrbacteria bacterium RIFOXYC12_FULL_57_11]